jgi:hypothetical protein
MVVLLIAFVAFGKGQVYNFKDGVKTRAEKGITKDELVPQSPEGFFYTWCYTFVLYLEDGSSAMIQYSYWRGAYLASKSLTIFSFIDADGTRTYWQDIVDDDQRIYTQDPPKLQMGKQSWSGFYPDFNLHLEGENLNADLHYKAKTTGWRPGEGPVHYGTPDGDWYDLLVVIPWAEVEGTMVLNGKERKIKGWGYSDHNTQTVLPTSQTVKIIALRSFSEHYAVNFLEYVAPESLGSQRTTWIIVVKDDKILYATDKWDYETSDITKDPRRGYPYPQKMKIKIDQPGCKLEGDVTGTKFIEALDVMDNVPEVFRGLVKRFIKAPVFIRQNAEVKWRLQMEGIDETFVNHGVFETTHVN